MKTDMYMVENFSACAKITDEMYLLNYDRTMEQIFDGSKNVLSEKGILLGITDPDVPYVVSSDGKIVAFVQADELWKYDKKQDRFRCCSVFVMRKMRMSVIRYRIIRSRF